MSGDGPSIYEIIAAGLAVLGAGELIASQYFAGRSHEQSALIASLLFWEALAMFACAGILFVRQDFSVATIIALIAIWMAAAGIGLLRAGFFDAPRR